MYMNNFTKITVIYGKIFAQAKIEIFDEILKSDYVQTKKNVKMNLLRMLNH